MTDEQYYELIQPYADAKEIMLSRLGTLKHNLYSEPSYKSIHTIQDRIKKKTSMEKKLQKKGVEATPMNAKDYLQDIAGIRVICYFVNDIYRLVDTIKMQADLIVVRERDYISKPKENGYRSFHLIVCVPLYYTDGMEYFPVEIQFRTMAMDFWASMEHRILYKKAREDRLPVAMELQEYAEMLMSIEQRFEHFSPAELQNIPSKG